MTEQERIEGINSEQLATATDRVLLAARFGRARPSSPHLRGHARVASHASQSAQSQSAHSQFAHSQSAQSAQSQSAQSAHSQSAHSRSQYTHSHPTHSQSEYAHSQYAHSTQCVPAQFAQGSQLAYLPQPSPTFAHGFARGAAPAPGFARGSQPHLYSNDLYVPQSDAPLYAPQAPARESSTEIRTRSRNDEHTVFTRRPRHYKSAWATFAPIALVTSLVSVAAAIALLL